MWLMCKPSSSKRCCRNFLMVPQETRTQCSEALSNSHQSTSQNCSSMQLSLLQLFHRDGKVSIRIVAKLLASLMFRQTAASLLLLLVLLPVLPTLLHHRRTPSLLALVAPRAAALLKAQEQSTRTAGFYSDASGHRPRAEGSIKLISSQSLSPPQLITT